MGHTAAQPAPPVPVYSYPEHYPRAFVAFNDRFPWVYEAMVEHARELKATGRYARVGVRYLFEHQRYSPRAREHIAELSFEFALDNNFSPWFGRLIEAQEDDLRGFFRLRRTRDEIARPDPGQTAMEFD